MDFRTKLLDVIDNIEFYKDKNRIKYKFWIWYLEHILNVKYDINEE